MVELGTGEYWRTVDFADRNVCAKVYPPSVAEHVQDGRIFVDSVKSVFFWHHCGFGYISGSPMREFLSDVVSLFWDTTYRKPDRLVLLLDDHGLESWIPLERGLAMSRRHEFQYSGCPSPLLGARPLPEGFVCREIGGGLFERLAGKVVPSMYWRSASEFLEKGKGFCILRDGKAAAWSFSSAVSHDETDIGVETDERFRGCGFATAVARRMIQYVLQEGRLPVWQCQVSNAGSHRTAERLGFQIAKTHSVFRKTIQ
ncbi:MAG: GNAT family N-acetyltransferase [Sphaerochaetaceae bacterium]|nr:GNAT family N-acetyltransferase [Sphaerochaetaceae bacterium]